MDSRFDYVMHELESLGTERTKKNYISRGVHEPLFGVATGAMKKIMKETGKDQDLADQLYQTGNYDAMYFAGMIAEPEKMSIQDFDHWMEGAYTEMISNYIVSVTLSESPLAQKIAVAWIEDKRPLYQSAGWSCFEWLLGSLPDDSFDEEAISSLLDRVSNTIRTQPDTVKLAMINFVTAVGVSYLPLHDQAHDVARTIEDLTVEKDGKCKTAPSALGAIEKAIEKGRLGFKRKAVRC